MGEARRTDEGSLSDLWQLYTYLGDKCDSYSRTSFEDFGLLFSTGALAAVIVAFMVGGLVVSVAAEMGSDEPEPNGHAMSAVR